MQGAPGIRRYWLPIAVLLGILILTQRYSAVLEYNRALILQGEYWRFFTGHFTHVGWTHLFLNVAAAVLLFHVFARTYRPRQWLIGIIFSCAGISLGLFYFNPDLQWYAGLSGLLHAIFVVGLIGEIKNGHSYYWLGLLFIALKIVFEQFQPALLSVGSIIGAAVVTEAHLFGVLSGVLVTLFLRQRAISEV